MNWQEDYRRRYERLKEAGKPFFPYSVFKDLVVASAVLVAIFLLAHYAGSGLEELADPTDTAYNPRPEWYFIFLFEALKFFPGRLEPIAVVVLPALAALLLLLIPFFDRGPHRHPLDRPLWLGLGVAGLAGWSALTWAGYHGPSTNPIVEKDPLTLQGQRLFRNMNCAYCHKIGGQGGKVGPELDKVAAEESEDWLARHFRDPQAVTPGSVMPKLNLLDDEIKALVAYMKSLEEPFSEEAPKLFAQNCAACHRIGAAGGEAGPDLSMIGLARRKSYIKRYVSDPAKVNPSSAMPSFKDQLTEVQIEDLSRYLSSLGR